MVKHTQTIYQLLPTNHLSVFDHFVGLALKGLRFSNSVFQQYLNNYLNSLKVLILGTAWIFLIIFCTKRGEVNDSMASASIQLVLGWLKNHLVPLLAPLVPTDYVLNLVLQNLSVISSVCKCIQGMQIWCDALQIMLHN